MPDNYEISPTNVQVGSPVGPNASIWSAHPMLGDVPGQNYQGRVVVELWDEGGSRFLNAGVSKETLEPALRILRNTDQMPVITNTPWSSEPAIGTVSDKTFRGRVVIELWDSNAQVAITGSSPVWELARRALDELLQIP